MRHGKRFNHLNRTAPHRRALLSNLANSLILHKRITTTHAKAKALRKYVEPLITKSKSDSTHSRRVVFSYLQNKESVNILFDQIADRVLDRPGGYTRIIKLGSRLGDNAEMSLIELVDYNDLLLSQQKKVTTTKKRTRRGSGGAATKSKKDSISNVKTATEEPKKINAEKAKADNKDRPNKIESKEDKGGVEEKKQ